MNPLFELSKMHLAAHLLLADARTLFDAVPSSGASEIVTLACRLLKEIETHQERVRGNA